MKKKYVVSLCTIVIISIFVLQMSNKSPLKINLFNDFVIVNDVQEAKENSQFIVKGQFTSFDKEWNMHRDDSDLSKEHPYEKITGKIYNFKIDDIISGNIKHHDIQINLEYSTRVFYNDDGIVHDENIKKSNNVRFIDVKTPKYTEPTLNKEYILYLNYDQSFDLYYASFEPFMIEINNNQLNFVMNNLRNDVYSYKETDQEGRKIIIEQQHHQIKDFIKGLSIDEFKQLHQS